MAGHRHDPVGRPVDTRTSVRISGRIGRRSSRSRRSSRCDERGDRRQAVLLDVEVPRGRADRRGRSPIVQGQARAWNGSLDVGPGIRRPSARASRSAGISLRRANPPWRAAFGNRSGSRWRALSVSVEPNERPNGNARPRPRWSSSPKRSSTRSSWLISPKVGPVVGVLARIVELDRPEPRGQADERRGIASIGRGEAGEQDEGGPFAEDPEGHPVARARPSVRTSASRSYSATSARKSSRAAGSGIESAIWATGSASKATLAKVTQQVRDGLTA